MKMYLKLVSALIKTVEPSDNEKKYQKVFYRIMGFIAVFGIMIPMAFLVGVIIYAITVPLLRLNSGNTAIELFLHLVSAFSFIFGLNVIFSIFYFSGDIENLLPLPLKPYQIIASKFTAALISESIMEFIIIIAAFAGFIIAGGFPFYDWIIAVFGMLTLPIIPLTYCGIICMLIMFCTRLIKNKDAVNKITGLLTLIIILLILFLLGNSGGFDTQNLTKTLSNSSGGLLFVMNCIFPHIQFIVNAMTEHTLLNLLIYIAINIAALAVFLLISEAIYFKTVVSINQGSVFKKKNISNVIDTFKEHSVTYSYLMKELRLLIRTPAYFLNCVGINLIWPVFLYLVFVLQGKTNFLASFIYGIHSGDEMTVLLFILGVSAVSVLVTAANSIASSAFTREGKYISFIKYIPVSYMAQINIKALVSIIISGSGMLIYVIAAGLWLNFGLKIILFCCVVSLLSVSFVSYFGVFMDSVNPKIVWDDELNALRGNYNIFFNMALAILLEAFICVGSYLLFKFTSLGALMIIIIIFVLLLSLNAASYLLCSKKATKNLEQLPV